MRNNLKFTANFIILYVYVNIMEQIEQQIDLKERHIDVFRIL